MANSTHAHLRYNILDHCFRNKSYGFKELLNVVNEGIEELYQEINLTRIIRIFNTNLGVQCRIVNLNYFLFK